MLYYLFEVVIKQEASIFLIVILKLEKEKKWIILDYTIHSTFTEIL